MSGFTIIDLIAGMIFIYFLLSIISSSIVEIALTYVNARAKLLEDWLTAIFNEKTQVGDKQITLGQAIMDHCSVTVLSGKGKSPSYIDAANFTSALLEKLTFDSNNPNSIATDLNTFISKIEQTPDLSLELKRVFLTYAYEARDKYKEVAAKTASDVEIFRSKIENWYDTSMDRLTGDLKRKYSRPFTMIVAIITVLLLNADSINIAKYLYSDPDARTAIAAQAYKAVNDSTAQMFNQRIASMQNANDTTVAQLKGTFQKGVDNINDAKAVLEESLPFGWTTIYFKSLFPRGNFWAGILGILSKITGLAATVFAIMMGAPFWFDLLNKVSNLRGTGNKPSTSSGAGNTTAASQTPAPISISVNTNKEEEPVG